MSLDNIIGVEEAGEILGLSPGTIKNKCAAGELPAKKLGKTWILNKKELYRMNFEELNGIKTVDAAGIEVRTTQDPFVSDCGKYYQAHAINIFGGEYEVKWEVINFETTDESEVCDWDNPTDVTLVK